MRIRTGSSGKVGQYSSIMQVLRWSVVATVMVGMMDGTGYATLGGEVPSRSS